MSWSPSRTSAGEAPSADPYVPVEEVARRLDLPLGVLLRRVEAGDVPARRVEGPDGVHYTIRLSDLGVQTEDEGPNNTAPEVVEEQPVEPIDVIGSAMPSSWPDKVVPPPSEELAAVSRPRAASAASNSHELVSAAHSSQPSAAADATAAAAEPPVITPRGRRRADRETGLTRSEPRHEVASMSLDPRELVAGLLDRWERTLEQRIYVEQRQRFETEIHTRQNLLKQLQLELQTARAEHAAAQAEKDRALAERLRQVADLQRELNTNRDDANRRRGWFWRK